MRLRYQVWFERPVDPALLNRAMREAFDLPEGEPVYVGELEQAPANDLVPRVRVLTRTAEGDFPHVAEVVVTDRELADDAELDQITMARGLAEGFGTRALTPDDSRDAGSWLLIDADASVTQVRVDRSELRHGRLRVVETVHPSGVSAEPGQPVRAPRGTVPLASLLAARDYLRDQLMIAARTAYPNVEAHYREETRPVPHADWAPLGRYRYHLPVRVVTAEGRPDWNAERAVRAAARALTDLGWKVREPAIAGRGDDEVWDTGASRDGYQVAVVMRQSEGVLRFSGQTPEFRVRRWEID